MTIEHLFNRLRGEGPFLGSKLSYVFGAVILFYLICGIIGLSYLISSVWTKDATGTVVEYYFKTSTDVYEYATVRHYGRSNVPSCAWDKEIHYIERCVSRDSTGTCTQWTIDKEYDYSVRDWKFHSTLDTIVFESDSVVWPKTNGFHRTFYKFRQSGAKKYITVLYRDKIRTLSVSDKHWNQYAEMGRKVNIRVWKKSGKIRKII